MVSLAAGEFAEAERLALLAAEEFETEGKPDAEALARALVARAAAQQGRTDEASVVIARARELSGRTDENVSHLLGIDVQSARVYAALGRYDEAFDLLQGVRKKAADWGLEDTRLEADVLLARFDAEQGADGAMERLRQAEEEARQLGFLGLVR